MKNDYQTNLNTNST